MALVLAGTTLVLGIYFGTVVEFRGWDNLFYLGQTSSLVEDGDVDLRNDALHSRLPALDLGQLLATSDLEGSLDNTFAIGAPLLWTPAYLAALPLDASRRGDSRLRWAPAQRAALYLSSLVLMLAIAWFLFFWLRQAGLDRPFALLSTVSLVLGSPLFFYGFYQYSMAHLASTFAVCLLLATALWLEREARPRVAFLCGIALGLLVLSRWQNGVMALVLLVPASRFVRQRMPLGRLLRLVLAGVAGGAPLVALQSHAWLEERGVLLAMPQGRDYVQWGDPELGRFLLSGYSGLVPWTPLLLLGSVGLLLPWRCRLRRSWALVALVVVLLGIYVNAAVTDWWGGSSYGPRRMTSSLPFVALGLANVVRLVPRRLAAAALVLSCVWGVFTFNLATGGVRDLSLVVLGRASDAPGTERETPQPTVAEARRLAGSWPLPYRGRGANLFSSSDRLGPRAGKVLTLLTAATCLLAVAALLARLPVRVGLAASLLAIFGLSLAAHARLAFGPPRDPAERQRWASLVRAYRQPSPDLAAVDAALAAVGEQPSAGAGPADAVRFLAALALLRRGETDRAEELIETLERRGLPAGAELRDLLPAPDDRLVTLVGGGVHTVVPGERYLLLPAFRFSPGNEVLDLELDFRPGPMEEAASYPLLQVRFDGRARAAVSISPRDGTRLDGDESVLDPGVEWRAHETYRVHLTWGEPAGVLRLEVASGSMAIASCEAPLLVEESRPLRLTVVFGRPREWRGEVPLWQASYADLRIAARSRR